MDEKTAMLIRFQRISMEVNASSPYKNEELSKALDAWSQSDRVRAGGATEIEPGYGEDDGGDGASAFSRGRSPRNGGVSIPGSEDKIRELNAVVRNLIFVLNVSFG